MSQNTPTGRLNVFEVVLLPKYMIENPESGKLYVVMESTETTQSVSFRCPCGCGKEVYLPCRAPGTPHRPHGPEWELTLHDANTVTLHPSILDRGSCQSHYWIKRNQVEWC